MQGRAFGFLALLGASWVAARIGIATIAPPAQVPIVGTTAHPRATITSFASLPAFSPERDRWSAINAPVTRLARTTAKHQTRFGSSLPSPVQRQKETSANPAAAFLPQLASPMPSDLVRTPVSPEALQFAPQRGATATTRPFDVYAYNFWRRGNGQTGTLGNGQYGGSQSAIITNVPLLRFGADANATRLALTGRLAVAHGLPRERELAAGLKWRPSLNIPVTVSAERRFRQDRPDAFALFIAGGQSELRLPMKFRLDGYGQAGMVSGKSGGAFVDAMLQARRPIGHIGPALLSAGAGAWAGGQDKVLRVDIGPSISADMPVAGARFRLEASWRLRVAGNADPGNGPGIALSTSF